MAHSNTQIPVKVLIHKQEGRVLFAEANSDFVDILFSFLTMPMGTIVRLLSKNSNSSQSQAIGSFINIYGSITNLENKYFATHACKDMLLNTRNPAESECRMLKINIDDIKPVEYYTCQNSDSCGYLSFYRNVKCKKCSKFLNVRTHFSRRAASTAGGQEGGFVPSTASFIITDDLRVIPNVPESTFAILYGSGFTDFGVFEEKTFNIGSTEILDLLKYSLMSKTPLTNLFLGKNCIVMDVPVQIINLPVSIDGIISFRNMTVNALVQKSSNRILLAFSSKDFVEFLFDLLNVPLGRVISLLCEYHTPELCVEKLYQSASNSNIGECFKSQEMRDVLPFPQSAMFNSSSNQLFPLKEEGIQKFYLHIKFNYTGQMQSVSPSRYVTTDSGSGNQQLKLASPLCDGGLLTGSTMYMVTDDLKVTPLSPMSCIKYLQSRNISPSDTEKQVIDIGVKEAICLLKAAMISTSVLTKGLRHLMRRNPRYGDF